MIDVDRMDSLLDELEQKVKDLESLRKMQDTTKELFAEIDRKKEEVEGLIKEFTGEFDSLKKDNLELITSVNEKTDALENDYSEKKNDLDEKFDTLTGNFDKKFDKNTEEISKQIRKMRDEIVEWNSSFNSTIDLQDNKITNIKLSINDLEDRLSSDLKKLNRKIDDTIGELENYKKENSKALDSLKTDIALQSSGLNKKILIAYAVAAIGIIVGIIGIII